MPNARSVPTGCGFFVTNSGREALSSDDTCECTPSIVGGLFQCQQCGTVYGTLRQVVSGDTGRRKGEVWSA